jgi:shikimate kinase
MDISFAPYLQIDQPVKKVFLWGMMGVGKSTYGKQMAKGLGWDWVDLDARIEKEEGRSIENIFQVEGEAYFRRVEERCLRSLEEMKHVVISTGGGTPYTPGLADWMRQQGLCIWLDAPAVALADRLSSAVVTRPLLAEKKGEELLQYLEMLLEKRQGSYKKAHLIVNVIQLKPKALTQQVLDLIQEKQ